MCCTAAAAAAAAAAATGRHGPQCLRCLRSPCAEWPRKCYLSQIRVVPTSAPATANTTTTALPLPPFSLSPIRRSRTTALVPAQAQIAAPRRSPTMDPPAPTSAPAVTPQGGQSALQPPWPRQACTRAPRRLQPPHRRRDETELVAPQQPNWGRCPIRLGQTHFLPAPSLRGAVCAAGLASAGLRRRRRLAVCFFAVVSPYCWCCSGTNPPGRCCHCSFPPSTLSGPLSYPISFLTGRRPAAASARTRSSLPRHHYTHIHTLSYTASTHLLCSSPPALHQLHASPTSTPPVLFFSILQPVEPARTRKNQPTCVHYLHTLCHPLPT